MSPRLPVRMEPDPPEEGTALLGTRLRCVVSDQLDNAVRDLRDVLREAEAGERASAEALRRPSSPP